MTFSVTARSIAFWSAEANTSAGAPLAICCISTSDAPKLNSTFVSGCCLWYASPTALNAFVRLAAADTTSSSAAEAGALNATPAASVASGNRRSRVRRSGRTVERMVGSFEWLKTVIVI